MADKEAENLRKQIEYLSNLIANAQQKPVHARQHQKPSVPVTRGDHQTQPVTRGDHQTQPVTRGDHQTQPVTRGDHQTQPVTRGDHQTQPVTRGDHQTQQCDDSVRHLHRHKSHTSSSRKVPQKPPVKHNSSKYIWTKERSQSQLGRCGTDLTCPTNVSVRNTFDQQPAKKNDGGHNANQVMSQMKPGSSIVKPSSLAAVAVTQNQKSNYQDQKLNSNSALRVCPPNQKTVSKGKEMSLIKDHLIHVCTAVTMVTNTPAVSSISSTAQEAAHAKPPSTMPVSKKDNSVKTGSNTQVPNNQIQSTSDTRHVAKSSYSHQEELMRTKLQINMLKRTLTEQKQLVEKLCDASVNRGRNCTNWKSEPNVHIQQSVQNSSGSVLQPSHGAPRVKSIPPSATADKSESKSENIVKSKYSFKRFKSVFDNDESSHNTCSSYQPSSQCRTPPTGTVQKSRYTLKRRRHISSNTNVSTPAQQNSHPKSRTSDKLVYMSKYSLRHGRKSVTDNSQNNTWKKHTHWVSQNQQVAKVIRSKYTSRKVFIDVNKTPRQFHKLSHKNYREPLINFHVPGGYNRYRGVKSWRSGAAYGNYPPYYTSPACNYRPFSSPPWKYRNTQRNLRSKNNFFMKQGRQGYYGYAPRLGLSQWQLSNRQRKHQQPSRRVLKRIEYLKMRVPFNPKLRLDRRTEQKPVTSWHGSRLVMINGVVYSSSQKQLLRASSLVEARKHRNTTRSTYAAMSVRHQPPASRDDTYIKTRPGSMYRLGSQSSRIAAMRVVNKSVARVAAAARYRKDSTTVAAARYCMFYNRFGRCNRQNKCPYVHDPEKVAVCTRFLRGTCKVKACPFSHKVAKEKMPVCSYFLRGVCSHDDCPYLHVNVSRDAEICGDFVNGYCSLGVKCKKRHTLVCPVFTQTGSCPAGRRCRLQHRKQRKRNRPSTSLEEPPNKLACVATEEPVTFPSGSPPGQNDPDTPFHERKLPAYISLNMKAGVQSTKHTVVGEVVDVKTTSETAAGSTTQIDTRRMCNTLSTVQLSNTRDTEWKFHNHHPTYSIIAV